MTKRRVKNMYAMKCAKAVRDTTGDMDIIEITTVKPPAPANILKCPSVLSAAASTDFDPDIIEITVKPKTYDMDSFVDLTNLPSDVSPIKMKKHKVDHSMLPLKVDPSPARVLTTIKKECNEEPQPFDMIRRNNSLFISYDPWGVRKGIELPEGHWCIYCRCPGFYCADIVLGKYVWTI